LTEARLGASALRLDERLSALGGGSSATTLEPEVKAPPRIRVGAKARARDGWEGSVTAVDEQAGHATLAAGAMRINVPLDELGAAGARAAQARRRRQAG